MHQRSSATNLFIVIIEVSSSLSQCHHLLAGDVANSNAVRQPREISSWIDIVSKSQLLNIPKPLQRWRLQELDFKLGQSNCPVNWIGQFLVKV